MSEGNGTLHDIPVTTIDGRETTLADWAGHGLLIVNVASECGLTDQYRALQELHDEFHMRGFFVLGFPCNQFGGQEPGDEDRIAEFCETNYGVEFPMFAKVEVNGPGAHPLYQWLRSEKGGVLGDRIKWNFTKFLLDREGNVVGRYGSTTKPEKLRADIERLL